MTARRDRAISLASISHLVIGPPFPNSAEIHERLDKVRALAVFASDPISSNAYATEAIMSVLILLGSGALRFTMPIAVGIATLVVLVVFSYVQTILHYPGGGGAYTVTRDNLGMIPSLFAAAALLVDYTLTVSVSVSAGIRALTSAFPEFYDYRVVLAIGAIVLLTWINLRGVRESGTVFAFPTYAFVGGVLVVIGIGLARYTGAMGAPLQPHPVSIAPIGTVSQFAYVWLLLRAFANGCTALTGIEAISNGVQAFKPPEAKNAATTMVWMGIMAMTLFLGISFLSTHLAIAPSEGDSVLSQLTRSVVGSGFMYYWVQFFTMMILILAANTGYQDFPRLSSFLAHDGFLPRWMQNRGSRLVFSSGILVLAFLSSLIVIAFQADEIAMLPLYALGVMLCFTLSQAGMVHLMGRVGNVAPGDAVHTMATIIHFESGWQWKRAINTVGAVTTGIVFVVLVVTKFAEGAWIIVLSIPLLVFWLRSIRKHYDAIAGALRIGDLQPEDRIDIANVVIVPIADIHRGTLRALRYSRRLGNDVRAVSVVTSPEQDKRIRHRWASYPEFTAGIHLDVISYEFRDILSPLIEYIEQIAEKEYPSSLITVVIPEFVPESVAAHLLHNQTANLLRIRLLGHENIVIIDIPYHIHGESSESHEQEQWVGLR